MREDLIELAKQQAAEIACAGHNGWGNTMLELAAALEAAREDASRWNELCRQIDAGEFHPGILEDAMNMGAGALEMHLDEAIDQARPTPTGADVSISDRCGPHKH